MLQKLVEVFIDKKFTPIVRNSIPEVSRLEKCISK